MHASWKNFILIVLMAAMPATAAAQRVPAANSGAVGGDVGVFLPRDSQLSSGLSLEGFYEYYFTPRVSIRTGLGWSNPQYDEARDPDASLRHLRIAVDLVHNWEGGNIHPFVGAGIATYILQQRDGGRNLGDSQSELGGTLFGGIELFTSPTVAFKAEGRYHVVPRAFGLDPDGFALTVGLKKYF
jgi:opacity protein-like surface antigen